MRTCLTILLCLPAWSLAETKPAEKEFTLSDEEKSVLELTNNERKAAGLPVLVVNEKLFQSARDHSANMARFSRLDHYLEGKSPSDRARAAGYASFGVAENIAWNQQVPTDVLRSWMSSSGHRANILNRGYTEIGIAVAINARGERYWTQVFGQPR
jgi:uncharacterized protein YkwD